MAMRGTLPLCCAWAVPTPATANRPRINLRRLMRSNHQPPKCGRRSKRGACLNFLLARHDRLGFTGQVFEQRRLRTDRFQQPRVRRGPSPPSAAQVVQSVHNLPKVEWLVQMCRNPLRNLAGH